MEPDRTVLKEKQQIRKRHQKLREDMSREEVQQKSRKICEKLLQSDWYENCRFLYAYYPLGNEVDCRFLLEQAFSDGKTVALPRTEKMQNNAKDSDRDVCRMEFYRITSTGQLAEGNFHVMEPIDKCPLIQQTEAIVLVPGVVFDQELNRYGYGKGYYDRYFVRFPGLRRMALAYEHQFEEKLQVSGTDIKMERIYTEESIYMGKRA